MRAVALVAVAALVCTAIAMDVERANALHSNRASVTASVTPSVAPKSAAKPGDGYVAGDGFTKQDVEALFTIDTPYRKDGTSSTLNLMSQCPPFNANAPESSLPPLSGDDTNTLFNWICYAAHTKLFDRGASHAVYKNYKAANTFAVQTLRTAMHLWTEHDILTNFKGLIDALSAPNRSTLLRLALRMEIADYVKSSDAMNGFLWAKQPTDLKLKWRAHALAAALSAQPRPTGKVYRGRSFRGTLKQHSAAFKTGALYYDKGFASTTDDREVALGYTDVSAAVVEVLEFTPLPAGSKGAVLGTHAGEVLWPQQTRFEVTATPVCAAYTGAFKKTAFVASNGKFCAGAVCTGKWAKLCVVKLKEVAESICPAGSTEVDRCGAATVPAQKVDFGRIATAGASIGVKALPNKVYATCTSQNGAAVANHACSASKPGCYTCAMCRDNNSGIISAVSHAFAARYCSPRASPFGVFL